MKQLHILIAVLLLPLLSVCSPPSQSKHDLYKSPFDLAENIDRILQDSTLSQTFTGIKVVSLKTGDVLYRRNSAQLFHPASNMKLFTTASALKKLGPAFTFKTWIGADSSAISDSVIQGDLYVKGFGDPDLDTEDLRRMIRQLNARGIRKITGDLICDASYLDDVYFGEGWMWDDASSKYFPPFSALTVNRNSVIVTVAPGFQAGDSLLVTIEPPTSYVKIENVGVTVGITDSTAIDSFSVVRKWRQRENSIRVEGGMPVTSQPKSFEIEVDDPVHYFGTIFSEVLRSEGILVDGEIVQKIVPDTAVVLVEHHSQPLAELLHPTNKQPHNNLYAELILKTMGAEIKGRPGTAQKGIHVINEYLSEIGIDTTRMELADGSGVSRYNLISPDAVVTLLMSVYRDFEIQADLLASLPIAGVDGTLEERMRETAAEGKLRAKTGTLRGVSALSGYTLTSVGEPLVFSIMMQHFVGPTSKIREIQDQIGELLSSWSR